MTLLSRFAVTVYDRTLRKRGDLGAYESCSVTLRHMAASEASFTVLADAPLVPALLEEGARMVVTYDGAHAISGLVSPEQKGLKGRDVIDFTVTDDFTIFDELLVWPDAAGLPATELRTIGGTRDYVTKTLVSEALARTGYPVPVRVAPVVTDPVVMSAQKFTGWVPLSDEVLPALLRWSSDRSSVADAPCWGLRVRQENDAAGQGIGLVVESYTATVRTRTLTASSGAVTDLSWRRTAPTCTRAHAIYRSQGDVPVTQVSTAIDATLETEWARVIEKTADVQVDGDTPTQAQITAAADQATRLALLGGRPVSSVSFTLAETDAVRYGRTVVVGDLVPIESPVGDRTEVLGEVTLAHDRSSGFVVSSTVGDSFSPPRVFAQLLRKLFALYRTRKA